MTGTALVTRAEISEIVGYRNLAIEKFATAFQAIDEAFATAAKAAGGLQFYVDQSNASRAFSRGPDERARFLTYLRQQADRTIWGHLIQGYGFDKLMDRQAHQEFRDQLEKDPPEVSIETAYSTLANLAGNAKMIFQRGIANAFAKLDRRFRSHDGFKIGERVVLTYVFDAYGMWNTHARHEDTIRDIERAFWELDHENDPDPEKRSVPERYAGIIGQINDARPRGLVRGAFTVENEYFRVRVFKNGNAHLWFKRDDLLKRVNKELADYYGEALGAGSDAVEDDPLARQSTAVAKNMGWFPTPDAVADRVVGEAEMNVSRWYAEQNNLHFRVLEPSAGEGAIVKALCRGMRESGATFSVDMIELHPGRADTLRETCQVGDVIDGDFLKRSPQPIYDRILMNPPFDRGLDIDHVAHAVKFLAPGGKIVAVMSASIEFRTDRKTEAFRKLVETMNGNIKDLPPGSFAESGTNVNTCLVTLNRKRA
ncbi:Methyltransferase domain-containing protein [Sphingomonas sp. NFR04]|uniref:DUF4942 domain-containing protein n=1 Tax=Sphingomonas sp. NFR04 TaxID=1566283 RepID=UPI0008F04CE0|nr:DUF4942 domain-containing protein [Sphingomonas sp. NFR04]SFJ48000.1 Methyltransferase domain-containing protein [Sphingomonas sp. NFR04]